VHPSFGVSRFSNIAPSAQSSLLNISASDQSSLSISWSFVAFSATRSSSGKRLVGLTGSSLTYEDLQRPLPWRKTVQPTWQLLLTEDEY